MTTAHIKALDLFAGTGWGVACQRLGIKEAGVEIMPEAVETRTANGMETIYRDVWDGLALTEEQHREQYGSYGLLIASPPCQTFSLAGKGTGRAALDEVLEAIQLHAYKDADALRAFGDAHDMRTALVLSPLAYVWRDRPRLVAMEQVPTVLPVWEACAEVMREWGYEVKVEILNAEQYGVPQTRKRAILVARRGGPVELPTPTHSRYYSRTPDKLDPGVKKWVSMAEALGWQREDPEYQVFCPTNLRPHAGYRAGDRPASSLAFGHDKPRWITAEELAEYRRAGAPNPGVKLTAEEAATIQSYPTHIAASGTSCQIVDPRPTDHPAPTITGAGNAEFGNRPTRAAGPGDRDSSGRRLTPGEAGALQTYERPFVWCGTRTKQFLQIGNAVPPLLAEHILAALIGIRRCDVPL